MTYFEFYDLPISFRVDAPALRRRYLQNSRKHHPDFHTLADDAQQDRALELSTLNNEAFKTLSDPDLRIQYVLQLKGLLGDEQQPALPQDFLMEMMEINEGLMELEFDPDPALYAQIDQSVKNMKINILNKVQPILDTYTDAEGQDSGLLLVREYFLKNRYLLRILENLSKFAPSF